MSRTAQASGGGRPQTKGEQKPRMNELKSFLF